MLVKSFLKLCSILQSGMRVKIYFYEKLKPLKKKKKNSK